MGVKIPSEAKSTLSVEKCLGEPQFGEKEGIRTFGAYINKKSKKIVRSKKHDFRLY